jgi:hypothetical protein
MHYSPQPGDILVTNFKLYQHWSLVSDKKCLQGKPMLISATKRNGTVQEETWDTVTKGHDSYITDLKHIQPIQEIVDTARSQINKWRYSVTTRNCEHFIKWVAGQEFNSKQVNNTIIGAVAGGLLAKTLLEKPTALKVLCLSALAGSAALLASRAEPK